MFPTLHCLPEASSLNHMYLNMSQKAKICIWVSVLTVSCNGLFLSWYNKNSIPRSVIQDLFIFQFFKKTYLFGIFSLSFCFVLFCLARKGKSHLGGYENLLSYKCVCRTRKIQFIHTLTHLHRCFTDSHLSEKDKCYHFLYLHYW